MLSPVLRAETWTTSIKPERSDNFHTASFRLWIDDAAKTKPVRGLLVLAPGWNCDGDGLADDKQWQDLAKELDFGIVAVTLKSNIENGTKGATMPYHMVHLGSGDAFMRALKQLADAGKHPEIPKVPWLAWGHSAGGQFAYGLACCYSRQMIAFSAIKGGYYETKFDRRVQGVPGLFVSGEKDTEVRIKNIAEIFEENRKKGAVWCLLAEKNSGHEQGKSFDLVLPFFREVAALRFRAGDTHPKTVRDNVGWGGARADHRIAPAGQLRPTPAKAQTVWLPGEVSARAWVKLSTGK